MKKLLCSLMAVLMCLGMLPMTASAAGEPAFKLYFVFDKENYQAGDTVTVSVCLDRNDGSDDSYSMLAFEDAIMFNKTYLKYIDSSANAANAKSMVVTGESAYYNQTYETVQISFFGIPKPVERTAKLTVAQLQFQALANTTQGVLYHSKEPQIVAPGPVVCSVQAENGSYVIGKLNAPTYPLQFSAGAGTGTAPAAMGPFAAGEVVKLPTVPYTREGYTAQGWTDGTKTYAAGALYTMPAVGVTLTVQWKQNPVKHTASYAADGGLGNLPAPAERYAGEKVNLPYNPFINNGFDFVGWSDGSHVYAENYAYVMPDKDVTFTAVWAKLDSTGKPEETPTVIEVGEPQDGYQNPFADVSETDWFYQDVITACKQGLINGVTTSSFAPNGSLTLAEAIKLAACMNQLNATGAVTLVNGTTNWYSTYLAYAIETGIVKQGQFADLSQKATRSEFAEIFAAALPAASYTEINAVEDNAIPDVKSTAAHAAAIYRLYRAGILGGSDAAHRYLPSQNIKRCEVATILARMMNSDVRLSFSLQTR